MTASSGLTHLSRCVSPDNRNPRATRGTICNCSMIDLAESVPTRASSIPDPLVVYCTGNTIRFTIQLDGMDSGVSDSNGTPDAKPRVAVDFLPAHPYFNIMAGSFTFEYCFETGLDPSSCVDKNSIARATNDHGYH
jgi:hypothetical protein